jgi:hypothetical protein
MGSFQSFFGFEFLVLDARTDRGSFTYGGPTNGGESQISENIVTDVGNGGNGGSGGTMVMMLTAVEMVVMMETLGR